MQSIYSFRFRRRRNIVNESFPCHGFIVSVKYIVLPCNVVMQNRRLSKLGLSDPSNVVVMQKRANHDFIGKIKPNRHSDQPNNSGPHPRDIFANVESQLLSISDWGMTVWNKVTVLTRLFLCFKWLYLQHLSLCNIDWSGCCSVLLEAEVNI